MEWLIVFGIIAAGAPGAVWTLQDNPEAPAVDDLEEVEAEATIPDIPTRPDALVFAGSIYASDPTRALFSKDAILWQESCHIHDFSGGDRDTADLWLDRGLTDGALEDLDLFFTDVDGAPLASYMNETTGLGLHEQVPIPDRTVHIGICLAGGAQASYRLDAY